MNALPFQFPSYTTAEKRVDNAIHVTGVSASLVGVAWLLAQPMELAVRLSLVIYGLGLIAMLTASALYNMAPASRLKEIFRRIDHAVIYVMIAGTYTPLAVNRLGGGIGVGIGFGVWLAAGFGVVLALAYPRRFAAFKHVLYLVMGWMIVPALVPMYEAVARATLWLLLAGGIVYSLGSCIYLLRRVPFHNAIWHAMVFVAASLHFAAMANEFTR